VTCLIVDETQPSRPALGRRLLRHRVYGGLLELAPFPLGAHIYGPESLTAGLAGRGRLFTLENVREQFEALGPYVLTADGDREELRELVDPRVRDIVGQLSPARRTAFSPGVAWCALGRGPVSSPFW
jgi:hypothetical protein